MLHQINWRESMVGLENKVELRLVKKDVGTLISERIEYLIMNFPESFDREMINENIETLVTASCDALEIKYTDHSTIGRIWKWISFEYLGRVVNAFEELIENDSKIRPEVTEVNYVDAFINVYQKQARREIMKENIEIITTTAIEYHKVNENSINTKDSFYQWAENVYEGYEQRRSEKGIEPRLMTQEEAYQLVKGIARNVEGHRP